MSSQLPDREGSTHEYLWVRVVVSGETPRSLDLINHGLRSPWPAVVILNVDCTRADDGWRIVATTTRVADPTEENRPPGNPSEGKQSENEETLTGLSDLAVAEHVYRLTHALVTQEAESRGWGRLHAAAVDIGERRVLVAGPSGAGKTTMARELVRRGHTLQSDEAVLIRNGQSVGLPRRIHIKESADTPLIAPEDHDVVRLDYDPVILAIAAPPRGGHLTEQPIDAIVLLGERGINPDLRRAETGEAFVALTSEASWFSPGALAVSSVSQVLRTVPVWHLSGHDRMTGADALEALAQGRS